MVDGLGGRMSRTSISLRLRRGFGNEFLDLSLLLIEFELALALAFTFAFPI